MMNLVCFTEESSAREMLLIVLPKILPKNYHIHQIISFEGKSDLDKQIEKKLKNYNAPNTHFLILRDQDSAVCTEIKQQLLTKVKNSGKEDVSIVRIACHELESFYLGDLLAVQNAFDKELSKKQKSKKFRTPDNLNNAKQELKKITKEEYQPISDSRAIAPHLKLDGSNTSISFNFLISGIQKLIENQYAT